MANKKNIIIAPCGNRSTFFQEKWQKNMEEKEFDLCLLFYHEQINNPSLYESADYFFHLKGFKYHMLYELFTKVKPEWLDEYEYFYFLDDDIDIDTEGINRMFALSKAMGSAISCAALSADSFCSWPMFKQEPKSFCRFVGQIEVMAPLFSKEALKTCLPSFIGNKSSWGVDSVWSKQLGYPEDKLIVFDTVIMKHTLPVGQGELYVKIGVNPHDEWNDITAKFGAKKHNYKEYSRLEHVSSKSHRVIHFLNQSGSFFARQRKKVSDYDLGSRVKSRTNKMLGKKK
jgi:hypothetical protein